ncbi:Peptidyl-prolyl cis-trans isomerase-like 3 [Myotis brandtii]|uniref:Peptidyl-prolyl cis-trans isomerase-like 3 n=1 Tax=Myotis brandtii TaxID=109478 RepID=S7N6L4_MYOBR|nr:Peptidyl-prolyl cis-trans isomerase-like 3 [Myotis brandtii]
MHSVTLHTDVGDIKIEIFCERTPKACEVPEEEVTVSGARNLRMNTVNILSTTLEVLYPWLIMAQIPMDLFFITYGKQPHLDMKYTVFGKVIDGLETLDELEKLPVNEKTYRPLNDVHIKDITIHANPFAQ